MERLALRSLGKQQLQALCFAAVLGRGNKLPHETYIVDAKLQRALEAGAGYPLPVRGQSAVVSAFGRLRQRGTFFPKIGQQTKQFAGGMLLVTAVAG